MTAPRVWITRTRPGADHTADRVRALGLQPLVSPLLRVRRLRPRIEAAAWASLAFTSRNAVAAFAAVSDPADWTGRPVFAVGDATAEAARDAGFGDVRSASGDVHALAALIARDRPPAPLLVPGPRRPAADLPALLAEQGVAARAVAVHTTEGAPARRGFRALAEGRLAAVLIHSPRAAEALAAHLKSSLPASCRGSIATALAIEPRLESPERMDPRDEHGGDGDGLKPTLIAISDAAARPLTAIGLPVAVADRPDEAALLDALALALGKPRPRV